MSGTESSQHGFSLDNARVVLRHTPEVLVALLSPLPPAMLLANEGPGTWSPVDILRHLIWGEVDDWVPRLRLIVQHGDAEEFRPFDRDEGSRRYADWGVPALLHEFSRLRKVNLTAIASLRASDLAAQGRHPEFGGVTLRELLATWVTHDLAHLTQIGRILTKESGRHVGPWRAYFSLLRPSS